MNLIFIIFAPLVFLFGSVVIYNNDLQRSREREFVEKWDDMVSLITARASIVMDENSSIDDKFASDLYLLPSLMNEIEAVILLDEQNRPVFSVGEEVVDSSHQAVYGMRALSGEKNHLPAKKADLDFTIFFAPVVRDRQVVAAVILGIDEGEPLFMLQSILSTLAVKTAVPFILWVIIVLYAGHKKSIRDLMEENYHQVELRLLSIGYSCGDPYKLAEGAARELCGVLRLSDCIIYVRENQSGEIVPYGRYPLSKNLEKTSNTVFEPADPRLQAMEGKNPKLYSLSKTGLARAAERGIQIDDKLRIAIPLAVGKEIVGLLDIEAGITARINDNYLGLCRRFAARTAESLKGRLANVDIEKQLTEIHGIVEAVEIIDSSTDLTTALGKITRLITEMKDIRFCRIFTMDEGGVNLVLRAETWAGEGIGDDAVGAIHRLDDMPLHKVAMLSGQSQEISSDDLESQLGGQKDIYRSDMNDCLILIIPLSLDNRQVGCMTVGINDHVVFPAELKFKLERLTYFLASSISRAQTCVRLKRSYDKLSAIQKQTVRTERLEAVTNLARGVSDNLASALNFLSENLYDLKETPSQSSFELLVKNINTIINNFERIEKRFGLFSDINHNSGFQQLELAQLVTESVGELDEAFGKFRNENGDLNIAVKIVGSGQIYGNIVNLKTMIRELALNSLEAIEVVGEISIETRIELNHAVLEISDNGTGMSDNVRGKIFEPFFTTKEGSGRGLGMSMVYGIVTAHNGSIDVISESRKGCKIVIKMPLVDPEQTALFGMRKGTSRRIPLSSS